MPVVLIVVVSPGVPGRQNSQKDAGEEVSPKREPPGSSFPRLPWPSSFSRICHLGRSTQWAEPLLSPVAQIQKHSLAGNSSRLAGLWTPGAALLC